MQEELERRLGDRDIRAGRDMYLDMISTWDYYLPVSERDSLENVDVLLETVSSRTRGLSRHGNLLQLPSCTLHFKLKVLNFTSVGIFISFQSFFSWERRILSETR